MFGKGSKIETRNSKLDSYRFANFDFKISFFRILIAGFALFANAAPGYAQGCAMCYSTAAAAKAAAIQALRSGILILLVPPALMFIAIFALFYRSRNRFNDGGQEAAETDLGFDDWLRRQEPVEPGLSEQGNDVEGSPALAAPPERVRERQEL